MEDQSSLAHTKSVARNALVNENPASTGFPMDTFVVTSNGHWTEIQHIGVGIPVLSRCEKSGELAYKRVTRVFTHTAHELGVRGIPLVSVKFRHPSLPKIGSWVLPHYFAGSVVTGIKVTAEHLFWIKGVGWVKAGQLQPGQQLEVIDPVGVDEVSRPKGSKVNDMVTTGQLWPFEVVSVEPFKSVYGGAAIVYNFEVEGFHTYFVGCFGIWCMTSM